MEGGDVSTVLQGHSVIEQAVGTLGPSLRGKAPIYNNNGQVIGIVSVGFLTQEVDSTIASYRNRIIAMGLATLVVGITGTI
jgi:two-component system, CitB family, sensor kinase